MDISAKPRLLKITTNKLVYFSNPTKIWMVNSGKVDLYCMELAENRKAKSTRKYLYTAEEGDVILSCSDKPFAGGVTLLGTSQVAKLIEYSIDDRTIFSLPFFLDSLENWVQYTANHYLELLPPIDFTYLDNGVLEDAKRGIILAPKVGLHWAKIKEGNFTILGNTNLDTTFVQQYSSTAYIPINTNAGVDNFLSKDSKATQGTDALELASIGNFQ